MTREEYNSYRSRAAYVRRYLRENSRPLAVYIPVSASVEFKLKCLQLYSATPFNFFIGGIGAVPHFPELGENLHLYHFESYEAYLDMIDIEALHRFYIAAHKEGGAEC